MIETNTYVYIGFLVTRPPVAYLGWGYPDGSDDYTDMFRLQVGEPVSGPSGVCQELNDGVFTREYSAGVATLDCNSYTATLPFEKL